MPGGGVALLCASKAVGRIGNDNSDVQAGINISTFVLMHILIISRKLYLNRL